MGVAIAVVLVLVIIAGIAVFVGFRKGVFRLEKVQAPDLAPSEEAAQAGAAKKAEPGREEREGADSDITLDYFAEEEAPARDEKAGSAKSKEADEAWDLSYDRLCNLKIGRGYLLDCQRLLNDARLDGRVFALAYFDFDRFSVINSLRGVSIGDYALSRMAQEMQEIFPESSVLTRISADHFTALFPLVDEAVLSEYADKLSRVVDRIKDDTGAKSGLRVCMGVAITNTEKDYDIRVLIHRANVARHCLKGAKNEAFSVFTPSMLETYLFGESALDDYSDNQYTELFAMYYAPVLDLVRARIVGCEALARWSCEEENYKNVAVTPDNGYLPTNNSKVIYQACRMLGRWHKAGKDIQLVCVNLSIISLYKHDIDEFFLKCLGEFQIAPEAIVAEVDASIIRVDWSIASRQLKKLHDIGVSIAVSGIDRAFTSLDILEGLPVNYIKLHKGFVHDMAGDNERIAHLRDIINIAKDKDCKVICEGVESHEQEELVREAGASYTQGLFYGRASEADEFMRRLTEHAEEHGKGKGMNTTTILDDSALMKGDFKLY